MEFIESIEQQAYENYKKYGILPSITIGQAILESGWGKSQLALDHNNLFGIKADNRWSGDIATMVTKENYSDEIEASFRKYASKAESIEDHGLFLYENEDGTFKGSLRVNGDTNVADIAAQFGGGGHVKAAGFSIEGPLTIFTSPPIS